MIRLDSLKLKIPLENVELQNDCFLEKTLTRHDGFVKSEQETLDQDMNKVVGLKNIIVNQGVLVELSAKILGDDYLQGININNIERIAEAVSPFMKILSFEDAELLRCDCTTNIVVDNVRESIAALRLGKSNSGYKVDDYKTALNNGIVFTGRQVSYKNRQIYYNKQVEMKLARNKDFLSSLNHQVEFYDSLKPLLRIEQNISRKAPIRKRFRTKNTDILNVLASTSSSTISTICCPIATMAM